LLMKLLNSATARNIGSAGGVSVKSVL